MAWTHRATAIYFDQVHKVVAANQSRLRVSSLITSYQNFTTPAPLEDKENFLGYAQQWVRFVRHPYILPYHTPNARPQLEFHFKIEDEVIFPILSQFISLEKSRAAHAQIAGPLAAFSSYLSGVASGTAAWSAEKAEEHAQALLPVLMAHFVEQLAELDPEALRKGGATTEALEGFNKGVAAKAGELVDPTREVPSMVLHNDGRLDWPTVPWPMTAEFKMPPELYKAHEGCVRVRLVSLTLSGVLTA